MASVAVAGHAQVRETPKNTTRIRPDKGRLCPKKMERTRPAKQPPHHTSRRAGLALEKLFLRRVKNFAVTLRHNDALPNSAQRHRAEISEHEDQR
jgi:hypothetical protein